MINYDQDFYGWMQEQATLLRAGWLNVLDINNLIEELDLKVLRDNPVLKPGLDRYKIDAFQLAATKASQERGLDEAVFPASCTWELSDVIQQDFYPE
jgi:hypothetical protein